MLPCLKEGILANNKFKTIVRKPSWHSIRTYSSICEKCLRKTMNCARQKSQSVGHTSNWAHVEDKTDLLQLDLVSGEKCPLQIPHKDITTPIAEIMGQDYRYHLFL